MFFYVACTQKKKSMFDTPGQHPKELNPYWKENGTGLPSASTSGGKRKTEGRSWILRSYKRALEQAKEKNVPFEQIAEKQWGSVEKIYSLLQSVGINPERPDSRHSKEYLYARSKHDERKARVLPPSFREREEISQQPRHRSRGFVEPDKDHIEVAASDLSQGWKKPGSSSSSKFMAPMPSQETEEARQSSKCEAEPVVESLEHEVLITDAMINAKGAKLIKAELTGNQKKIGELKEEIEGMRAKKKSQELANAGKQKNKVEEKVALLTTTDRFGRVRPADVPAYASGSAHKGKKGKSKKSYYSNDEDYSMKALMEMERKMTADDTHLAIAKMASKFVRSSNDDIVDDVVDFKVKTNPQKDQEKELAAIKLQSRKMEEILERCRLCINSSQCKQHLIVAMGINTYLAVPSCQSLSDYHCMIVPFEHTACSLQMDENVWSEVKIFQKGLTKMFFDKNMDSVFTESYSNPARKAHMCIECVPLPGEEGGLAPMYFKKAILESDAEWSENKRLIDTRSKGVRNSIPLGLPYFSVDFNNEGGFAHVIEDSSRFPHYFGKEVIGGLLDVDPILWLKPPPASHESQKKRVDILKALWEPYDWTKKLKEEH